MLNIKIPKIKSIAKDENGSILLEFAGSIIILIVLYLGTITIGLRMVENIDIHKVARDGARAMALTGSSTEAVRVARESAYAWGLNPNKIHISTKMRDYGARNLVTCNVEYKSSPFSRMFPTLVNEEPVDEKVLKAEATFGWWDAR